MAEPISGPASITVNVTNNTGGCITFNTLSFLSGNNEFSPSGYPPIVLNTLQAGGSATIFYANSLSTLIFVGQGTQEQNANPITKGTATFNLPNGYPLTIDWDLDASQPESPTPTVSSTTTDYAFTGLTDPVNEGSTFIFNVSISVQS